jgi:hypothetical protein
MSKIKVQIEIEESSLFFVDVPAEFKNFKIANYGYAGYWLKTQDMNHNESPLWQLGLPSGYHYEILGFVNDVFPEGAKTEKNFALKRTS